MCFWLPPELLVLVCVVVVVVSAAAEIPLLHCKRETAEEVVTEVGLSKALKRLEVIAPHVLKS